MINKETIKTLVEEWLQGNDYFLVDIMFGSDDRIVIEIDHADGVWIEDCVELSKFIEDHLDRDKEDFELEVGSAGLTAPLRTLRQYAKFEGETMEVMLRDGRKLRGILGATDDEGFDLTWTTLEHVIDPATGKRSKKKQEVEHHEHLSHKDVNRIYYNF